MAKQTEKPYNFPSAEIQLFVKESLQEIMREFTEITRAAAKELAQLTVETASNLAKITLSTAIDLAKITKDNNEHFTAQILSLQNVNTEKQGARRVYVILAAIGGGVIGGLFTLLSKILFR
jgi:hypothetical protein